MERLRLRKRKKMKMLFVLKFLAQDRNDMWQKIKSTRKFINTFNSNRKLIFLLACTAVLTLLITCILAILFSTGDVRDDIKISKALGLFPPNPEVPLPPSPSSLYIFKKAAVCSDNGICSKIGRDIFYRGGNVMDATLATLFCNGLTTMQSIGLGGGFIMNIFKKTTNKAYTLNAREIAPVASTKSMFLGNHLRLNRSLSIGTPGEVLGYWEAHKRFSSMTWKEIIQPSIKICEKGFELTKHMYDSLFFNKRVIKDIHLSSMFINKNNGEYYRIGEIVKPAKTLCETYRILANNGGFDFYNGTLARMLLDDLKEIGSIINATDLELYKVQWQNSIPVSLNNNVMHVVPATGSGPLLALIMNILRGYNFTKRDLTSTNYTIKTYHRIIESFKFAFAKRSELGDLRFNNLTKLMRNLTSADYGNEIRELIDDNATYKDVEHYGAKFWSTAENGTSHLSVLAPNGDAISVTSSINFYFGSGHSGRKTGIIFNSGMDDFSTPGVQNYFNLPSSVPNFIEPRKRAMSSMCPTIVTDKPGNVKLIIGAAGGTKILTSVAWVIIRILWFNEDIKKAIDSPRIHHQLIPNEIQYEFGNTEEVIAGLKEKGHMTSRYQERGSIMCGIQKTDNTIYANADYRKKSEMFGL